MKRYLHEKSSAYVNNNVFFKVPRIERKLSNMKYRKTNCNLFIERITALT